MISWRRANGADARRLGLRCGLKPMGRHLVCPSCAGLLEAGRQGAYRCTGRCGRDWSNVDFWSERWGVTNADAAQMICDLLRTDRGA